MRFACCLLFAHNYSKFPWKVGVVFLFLGIVVVVMVATVFLRPVSQTVEHVCNPRISAMCKSQWSKATPSVCNPRSGPGLTTNGEEFTKKIVELHNEYR